LSQVSAFETGKIMSYETFDFKLLIWHPWLKSRSVKS